MGAFVQRGNVEADTEGRWWDCGGRDWGVQDKPRAAVSPGAPGAVCGRVTLGLAPADTCIPACSLGCEQKFSHLNPSYRWHLVTSSPRNLIQYQIFTPFQSSILLPLFLSFALICCVLAILRWGSVRTLVSPPACVLDRRRGPWAAPASPGCPSTSDSHPPWLRPLSTFLLPLGLFCVCSGGFTNVLWKTCGQRAETGLHLRKGGRLSAASTVRMLVGDQSSNTEI